jgi:hypothetical protein
MEEAIKERLTSRDIWMRGLYMVFFGFAYSVAELVIVLVVIFQFVATLIAGHANENALRLGNNLSKYVYQVFQFQTFNTESRPFPFSDWPDEPLEDNVWNASEETDDALDVVAVEPDPESADDEPTARD